MPQHLTLGCDVKQDWLSMRILLRCDQAIALHACNEGLVLGKCASLRHQCRIHRPAGSSMGGGPDGWKERVEGLPRVSGTVLQLVPYLLGRARPTRCSNRSAHARMRGAQESSHAERT